jgi:hypothetical protein
MGPMPMTIMRLLMGISFESRSPYYEATNCVNAQSDRRLPLQSIPGIVATT